MIILDMIWSVFPFIHSCCYQIIDSENTHSDQAARLQSHHLKLSESIYRLPLGGRVSVWGLLFVCIFIKNLLCLMIWEKSWCWGTKYVISTSIIQVFAKKYFWSQYLMKGCWIELLMDGNKQVASTLHHSSFQLKLILMNNDILCQGLSTLPTSDYLYDYSISALILLWINTQYTETVHTSFFSVK